MAMESVPKNVYGASSMATHRQYPQCTLCLQKKQYASRYLSLQATRVLYSRVLCPQCNCQGSFIITSIILSLSYKNSTITPLSCYSHLLVIIRYGGLLVAFLGAPRPAFENRNDRSRCRANVPLVRVQ